MTFICLQDWSIHYDKNEDDAVQPRFEGREGRS